MGTLPAYSLILCSHLLRLMVFYIFTIHFRVSFYQEEMTFLQMPLTLLEYVLKPLFDRKYDRAMVNLQYIQLETTCVVSLIVYISTLPVSGHYILSKCTHKYY